MAKPQVPSVEDMQRFVTVIFGDGTTIRALNSPEDADQDFEIVRCDRIIGWIGCELKPVYSIVLIEVLRWESSRNQYIPGSRWAPFDFDSVTIASNLSNFQQAMIELHIAYERDRLENAVESMSIEPEILDAL